MSLAAKTTTAPRSSAAPHFVAVFQTAWAPKETALRGARDAGKKFEQGVLAILADRYQVARNPQYRCKIKGQDELAFYEPDGIIWLNSIPTVVEIKLSYTSLAYDKLMGVYRPMVALCYKPERTRGLLIIRNMVSAPDWPKRPTLLLNMAELNDWLAGEDPADDFGVLKWPDTRRQARRK